MNLQEPQGQQKGSEIPQEEPSEVPQKPAETETPSQEPVAGEQPTPELIIEKPDETGPKEGEKALEMPENLQPIELDEVGPEPVNTLDQASRLTKKIINQ